MRCRGTPRVYLLQSRKRDLGDGRNYGRDEHQKDTPDWLAVQRVLWDLINAAFPADRLAGRFAIHWDRHVEVDAAGQKILTCSRDGTARIWDARTGEPFTVPLEHGEGLLFACFSPDGRLAATAGSTGARVWDAGSGAAVSPPVKRTLGVTHLAFSPDGSRLATAGGNGMAEILDPRTGGGLIPPIKHDGLVAQVAFSPDGRRLATVCVDGAARIWDASGGAPAVPPLRHTGAILHVAFSPDGYRVLTSGEDRAACIWDAVTGEPIIPSLSHGGPIAHAAFSPDGFRVATASTDRTARLWDVSKETRQAGDLALLAQVLSGRKFDQTGGLVLLDAEEMPHRLQDAAAHPAVFLHDDPARTERRDKAISEMFNLVQPTPGQTMSRGTASTRPASTPAAPGR